MRLLIMRKFMVAYEAWEGAEYDNDMEISQEEAEVMGTEAKTLETEMSNDVQDAERALDTADSMEDLAIIADSVDEATPTETALMQVAGDMAVAGTDVDSEDVVPATECFKGRRVAAEGFRETARNIWAAIKKFVKDIWAKLEKWFYNIFGAIPLLRKSIEKTRKRMEETLNDGKSIQGDAKKFELNNGLDSLRVGQDVKTKATDVNKGAEVFKTVIEGLLDGGLVAKYGEKVADAIEEYDGESKTAAETSARKVYDALNTNIIDFRFTASVNSHEFGSEYSVEASSGVLGGKEFVYRTKIPNINPTSISVLDMLNLVRGMRFSFQQLSTKVKTKDSIQFETMKTSEIEESMDIAESILDILENFHRRKGKKDLEKSRDRIEKVCNKVESQSGKVDDSVNTSDQREILAYTRAVYKFAPAYASLASTALTQSYNIGLQIVRTLLMLSSRSLSQYTTK